MNERRLLWLRTRALFFALLSSGSRISAILSLDRDSIDEEGTARVIQKGGSRHQLLFSDQALKAITDYLNARRDSELALWIGHPWRGNGRRLTPPAVDIAWNRLTRDLGLRHFSSHQLRHSCATGMLRNGVDSVIVGKHLGWRGLAMAQTYIEVNLDQRREAIAALGIGA